MPTIRDLQIASLFPTGGGTGVAVDTDAVISLQNRIGSFFVGYYILESTDNIDVILSQIDFAVNDSSIGTVVEVHHNGYEVHVYAPGGPAIDDGPLAGTPYGMTGFANRNNNYVTYTTDTSTEDSDFDVTRKFLIKKADGETANIEFDVETATMLLTLPNGTISRFAGPYPQSMAPGAPLALIDRDNGPSVFAFFSKYSLIRYSQDIPLQLNFRRPGFYGLIQFLPNLTDIAHQQDIKFTVRFFTDSGFSIPLIDIAKSTLVFDGLDFTSNTNNRISIPRRPLIIIPDDSFAEEEIFFSVEISDILSISPNAVTGPAFLTNLGTFQDNSFTNVGSSISLANATIDLIAETSSRAGSVLTSERQFKLTPDSNSGALDAVISIPVDYSLNRNTSATFGFVNKKITLSRPTVERSFYFNGANPSIRIFNHRSEVVGSFTWDVSSSSSSFEYNNTATAPVFFITIGLPAGHFIKSINLVETAATASAIITLDSSSTADTFKFRVKPIVTSTFSGGYTYNDISLDIRLTLKDGIPVANPYNKPVKFTFPDMSAVLTGQTDVIRIDVLSLNGSGAETTLSTTVINSTTTVFNQIASSSVRLVNPVISSSVSGNKIRITYPNGDFASKLGITSSVGGGITLTDVSLASGNIKEYVIATYPTPISSTTTDNYEDIVFEFNPTYKFGYFGSFRTELPILNDFYMSSSSLKIHIYGSDLIFDDTVTDWPADKVIETTLSSTSKTPFLTLTYNGGTFHQSQATTMILTGTIQLFNLKNPTSFIGVIDTSDTPRLDGFVGWNTTGTKNITRITTTSGSDIPFVRDVSSTTNKYIVFSTVGSTVPEIPIDIDISIVDDNVFPAFTGNLNFEFKPRIDRFIIQRSEEVSMNLYAYTSRVESHIRNMNSSNRILPPSKLDAFIYRGSELTLGEAVDTSNNHTFNKPSSSNGEFILLISGNTVRIDEIFGQRSIDITSFTANGLKSITSNVQLNYLHFEIDYDRNLRRGRIYKSSPGITANATLGSTISATSPDSQFTLNFTSPSKTIRRFQNFFSPFRREIDLFVVDAAGSETFISRVFVYQAFGINTLTYQLDGPVGQREQFTGPRGGTGTRSFQEMKASAPIILNTNDLKNYTGIRLISTTFDTFSTGDPLGLPSVGDPTVQFTTDQLANHSVLSPRNITGEIMNTCDITVTRRTQSADVEVIDIVLPRHRTRTFNYIITLKYN